MQIRVHGGNGSVLSRRSCYLTSFLFIFLHKTHTIEKYLIETSNQRCLFIVDESKWLRNQEKLQTKAGNGMKKHSLPLIFTFYLNRGTSVPELFSVVVFQLKRFSMRSVLTHLPATISANWIAVERFKMNQITFISIHILANQNSYHDDKSK